MSPGPRSRRKDHRGPWRLTLVVIVLLSLFTAVGLTAANVVSPSRASDRTTPIPADSLKPSECDELTLTTRVTGAGIITGTLDNDWIVGSEQTDTIEGLAGDDCIEGKGGDDVIDGGLGNDVCIGGGGNDTFVGCETEIQ